jgi:hypothetical protein
VRGGSYLTCEQCGGRIAEQGIVAVPTASTCIDTPPGRVADHEATVCRALPEQSLRRWWCTTTLRSTRSGPTRRIEVGPDTSRAVGVDLV